jgi:xanthine dehydrogenase small subunit
VLDFVRYHKRLTGTKIGCREGDCGACTVLVGDLENGSLVYRSMTSCLMPLANAHGKHIVTVEGINGAQLTPVQQAMADTNGTQCGFCTIGFVMSLTGFSLQKDHHSTEKAIASIDGNICRCTGYKSIERAAEKISRHLQETAGADHLSRLIEAGFVPAYFSEISDRLNALKESFPTAEPEGVFHIGGGTDLLVQKPETVRHATLQPLFGQNALKQIEKANGQLHVGASVTVTQFAENDHVRAAFPDLDKILKLVSSTPIRNMATLAGNIVNASPIGDMSVFFLALDTTLTLHAEGRRRQIPLRAFFQAYKKTALEPGEIIEKISFTPPPAGAFFNFEKVCKRTHLDIASVNTSCQWVFAADGTIAEAHLSAGGVWPYPKYLEQTSAFLKGKKPSEEVWAAAEPILQSEVAPISDVRGAETYKRLLLSKLFLAHLVEHLTSKP